MKRLTSLVIFLCLSLLVVAQTSTITVMLNGNVNRTINIDGTNYSLSTYTGKSQASNVGYNSAVIPGVSEGEHTLMVTHNNNSRRNDTRKFFIRDNYDLIITVNGNGTMDFRETLSNSNGNHGNRGNRGNRGNERVAMNTNNFNIIYNEINSNRQMASRIAALNTVFANRTNYFTSTQVRQLINLATGEANRLALAKSAFGNVVDPDNFTTVYTLLRYQSSRNDLANYVKSIGAGSTTNTRVAMNQESFTNLYNTTRNIWQMGAKINALNTAFVSQGNYFSSYQINQLLMLISDENERFQLAKISYRAVTDPNSFTNTVINSFTTQNIRNELQYFVRNYDTNNPGNGYNYGQGTAVKTPMSTAEYAILLQNIKKQWFPGAKKTAALEAFTNINNYFTTDQARQIITVDENESDRLDLAKASYRSITDPSYFYQVYDLFSNTTYREDLIRYVNNFTSSTANNGGYSTTYDKAAMNETNFNVLYEDIRKQWFPGAKKTAVLTAFSNATNYFTIDQVVRLITLDSDEIDRFDMAKSSLRSIIDPANINTLYNVFTSSTYKEQLAAYVRDYRWN
ncbi:MAG: DUF4476 domain-containing protein [Ferruginibacter sp.]